MKRLTKIIDMLPITDSMEKAVKDALTNGTGILKVNDDGSIKHIPYEEILKAANEVNNKDGT